MAFDESWTLDMNSSDEVNLTPWAHAQFLEKVTGIAPNIIYIFNQRTQSNEYANRSLPESLGYTIEEIQQMGDALFVNLCHPEDLRLIGPHFDTIRQLVDDEVASLEYRMKHKNGHWVWLLGYDAVFERDEFGDVVSHIGIATDITEQKLAQEAALAERRATDAANEELRSFAYSMSHDMKAPSNTLHLLLNELMEQHGDSLDEDATELLTLSLNTVGRMQILVDDVLNYTRIIGQVVEFSDVNLNDLVADVAQDLLAATTHSGAELTIEQLPTVKGSRMQLGILFQNLIANALKYHPADSKPVVTVSSSQPDASHRVLIHVKDNGIGIAQEHQQKIFEMFNRLHVNKEFSGTGLGLTICKRIALNHGGEISVESKAGKGATFNVSLKLHDN